MGATAVPRPAEGCRSVWPAGYREGVPPLLEEWQGCVKRIEELTEEYTKHRNRVCLGNTMRGKPSSFLEECVAHTALRRHLVSYGHCES